MAVMSRAGRRPGLMFHSLTPSESGDPTRGRRVGFEFNEPSGKISLTWEGPLPPWLCANVHTPSKSGLGVPPHPVSYTHTHTHTPLAHTHTPPDKTDRGRKMKEKRASR